MSNFNLDTIAEELKALIVEAEFNSRMALLEAYHEAGRVIEETYNNPDNPFSNKEDLVQGIAGKIGRSERTLWLANKFYKTYPDINRLPEGKNISWNKVIKLLASPKEDIECEHEPIVICRKCRKELEDFRIESVKMIKGETING